MTQHAELEIRKDIPIPPKHQFAPLLKMEIGDCVEFTDRTKFKSAHSYLYLQAHFRIRQKVMSKKQEPFLGRLWRVE
jgi:hypothetical protein